MIRQVRDEAGYSLVEVMVSIMILTIAILPMVSMFDTALRSATMGSNYDKARALANLKLEQAKSLPFDSSNNAVQDLKDNFPELAGTITPYNGSGCADGTADGCGIPYTWKPQPGATFAGFEYRIEKQYMAKPSCETPTCPPQDFASSSTANGGLIRVTVTVRWGENNTYTTFGLVGAQ